jgi:hypothetical protein
MNVIKQAECNQLACINVAQDIVWWRAFMVTVMKLAVQLRG